MKSANHPGTIFPAHPNRASGASPHKRFYEKVIKVKADVAAVLDYFFPSELFVGAALKMLAL